MKEKGGKEGREGEGERGKGLKVDHCPVIYTLMCTFHPHIIYKNIVEAQGEINVLCYPTL